MSGAAGVAQAISWLQTLFHIALALAFVIVCFVKMKRLGTAGASMLAAIGILDVLGLLVYRFGMLAMPRGASSDTMDAFFTTLGAIDMLFDLSAIGLAIAAFVTLRKPLAGSF